MILAFWICVALVAYTFVGYPIWLWIFSRVVKRPIAAASITPTVSIVIAARNEEQNLPAKLENLRALDYPRDRLQIIIASDGSTDGTARLLLEQGAFVVPVIRDTASGKASALNAAVRQAAGEILVFLDARQLVDSRAVAELAACFADPSVGAVSGELVLDSRFSTSSGALGIYWEIEKIIRKLEAATGSVVGVTGAIYAIRRELFTEIPPGTILDDVFVPVQVVRAGKRVVFQPKAIAFDRLFSAKGKEFGRKVRTLTGNYQLARLAPWLLSPLNPLFFRFLSHKLMRLFVPFLLVVMLVTTFVSGNLFYQWVFWLQILFYLLAVLGSWIPAAKKFKPVSFASTFTMLNLAAAFAFYNFVMGRTRVWR